MPSLDSDEKNALMTERRKRRTRNKTRCYVEQRGPAVSSVPSCSAVVPALKCRMHLVRRIFLSPAVRAALRWCSSCRATAPTSRRSRRRERRWRPWPVVRMLDMCARPGPQRAVSLGQAVGEDGTLVKLAGALMEECIVCYASIDPTMSPGLKMRCCGKYQCERCQNILAEHCSICHRETINNKIPCEKCGIPVQMFESRCCVKCENLCCVNCSEPTYCCRLGRDIDCVHCACC